MYLPRRNHSSSTRLASAIVAPSCKQERGTSHSWSVEKASEGEESVAVVYDSNKKTALLPYWCAAHSHILHCWFCNIITSSPDIKSKCTANVARLLSRETRKTCPISLLFFYPNAVHLWSLLSSGVLIQCSTPHSKLAIFAQSNRGKRILQIAFDFLSKVNCVPAAATAAKLAPCCELPASAPAPWLLNRTVCHACHSRGLCLWVLLCSIFIHFPRNRSVKAITSRPSTCTSAATLLRFALQILKLLDRSELLLSGARTREKTLLENLHC